MTAPYILVLYDSRHGSVAELAVQIANGCESVGVPAMLRSVSPLDATVSPRHPVVTLDELAHCHGLILGSPVRFGQMTAAMKQFWEQTSHVWLKGQLIDKPAAVFTSSSSLHGGQEACLLGMMVPLLHHGMLLVGQPYDEPALHHTTTGGTPYGPSHVHRGVNDSLSQDEITLCRALGARVAKLSRLVL